MTAPVEEVVEQDCARIDELLHIFCAHCYGEGAVENAVALCSTVARKRGFRGGAKAGEICEVCGQLFYGRMAPCRRCGLMPR